MPLPVSCRSDVITTVGYYTAQYDSPVVTITSDLVQNIHSLMSRFLSIPLLRVLSALFWLRLRRSPRPRLPTSCGFERTRHARPHQSINQGQRCFRLVCRSDVKTAGLAYCAVL
jgi:hypothetical protein